MSESKPRRRVAIAYARSFAAALVQNAEVAFQQSITNLTDDEMLEVEEEMQRIFQRIKATINQDDLAKAVIPGKEIGLDD